MIEVTGVERSPERAAGEALAEALREAWPALSHSSGDRLRIATNVKLYGYDVQDLDVVCMLALDPPGHDFQPLRALSTAPDGVLVKRDVAVRNLVLVVEVKAHDAREVRFTGNSAFVRYQSRGESRWHDATEQSVRQAHALRSYLGSWGVTAHVANLVWLTSLEEKDLPARPHNVVASDIGGRAILTAVAEVMRPYLSKGSPKAIVSSFKPESADRALAAPLFKSIAPSSLDRARMDRVARREGLREDWLAELGRKQIVLRGRGGTGKTVALLQLAHRAYEERGARSLILTYNLALAADMRRTMMLLGMPGDGDHGGMRIESVMAFIGRLLSLFGVLDKDRDFLEQYESGCKQLVAFLNSSEIPIHEVRALLDSDPLRFSFDLIMIDEGQDWPADEISILRACFPPSSFVVADGVDQLVRGERTNWNIGVPMGEQMIAQLSSCLRLKSNIAHFANALAAELKLEGWHVAPSPHVSGGRVLVVEGDLESMSGLPAALLSDAKSAGNSAIDLLFLVPSSLAKESPTAEGSIASAWLRDQGVECWDGARLDVRKDIPRSIDAVRMVQYESCRGLEGWSVVCLGLEEFFELHSNLARQADKTSAMAMPQNGPQDAARWLMMPITRPMDTLVLHVRGGDTRLREALRRVQLAMPDIVSWCHGFDAASALTAASGRDHLVP